MSLASRTTVLPRTDRAAQECWPLMTAARWGEPELSIGARCGSMDLLGRYKCWQVRDKSPAHIVWETVSKAIFELLEDQHEHLNARNFDFGLHMFMIGRKPAISSPTVLFSCESKQPRRMAMEMVHKKGILTPFPGVLMAESSRVPKPLGIEKRVESNVSFPAVYTNGPIRNCGTPILLSNANGQPPRKATIGGTVCIVNEYFGLTAGHPLFDKSPMNSETHNDLEFTFYGHDDSSESLSDGEDSVEVTSMWNISSNLTVGPVTLNPKETHTTPKSSNYDSTIHNLNRIRNAATSEEKLASEPEILGTLFAASPPEGDMDWALIRFTHTELMAAASYNSPVTDSYLSRISQGLIEEANLTSDILINKITRNGGYLYPEGVESVPADTQVLIRTGSISRSSSNVLQGELSAVPSFSKRAGCTVFHELWTVRLYSGAFYDGDCGSWVVDAKSGNLFGHIVSGYAATEIAHIIPAIHTFRDIERRIWQPVELSTRQRKTLFLSPFHGDQANSAEKDPYIAQKTRPLKSGTREPTADIEAGPNTSLELVSPPAFTNIARDESRYVLSVLGAITRAFSVYITYKALPYDRLRKIVVNLGYLHLALNMVKNELEVESDELSYTRKEQWNHLISGTKMMLDDLEVELVTYENFNSKTRPKHRLLHERFRDMIDIYGRLLELVAALSIFAADLSSTFTCRIENLITRCFKVSPVSTRGNSKLGGQPTGSLEEWEILARFRQELEKVGLSKTTIIEERVDFVQTIRRSLKDFKIEEVFIPKSDSELASTSSKESIISNRSFDPIDESRNLRHSDTNSTRSTSTNKRYSPTKSRSVSSSIFKLIATLFRLDSALLEAAIAGDIARLLDLIMQGANVNKADRWAWTALHIGAYNGQREIVEALIRHGANVKARTVDEETPLQLATLKGHGEIVTLIIEAFKERTRGQI